MVPMNVSQEAVYSTAQWPVVWETFPRGSQLSSWSVPSPALLGILKEYPRTNLPPPPAHTYAGWYGWDPTIESRLVPSLWTC